MRSSPKPDSGRGICVRSLDGEAMAPRAPSDPDRICGTNHQWDPPEISQESCGIEWPRCRRLKKSRTSSSRDSPKAAPVFRGRALATRRLTDEVRTSEKLASSCCGASDAVLPAIDPAHFRSATLPNLDIVIAATGVRTSAWGAAFWQALSNNPVFRCGRRRTRT